MRLRPQRRRNLVVWRQSGATDQGSRVTRPSRTRRMRKGVRIGMLLAVLGLLPLVRAVRARWKPLLAGTGLTVAGVILRGSGPGSAMLLPGLMLLMAAPLLPGTGHADLQRTELERELAGYWTNAQRHDLEAMLDRYPDDVTREVREILAGQAGAGYNNQVRSAGRYWCRGF
ncbi:MAG TPA: hypothetical protein VJ254_14655 [Streptosporangiaceae bacterium]|nr:hypothetical protein [Streptosporangiaceae bacterium]